MTKDAVEPQLAASAKDPLATAKRLADVAIEARDGLPFWLRQLALNVRNGSVDSVRRDLAAVGAFHALSQITKIGPKDAKRISCWYMDWAKEGTEPTLKTKVEGANNAWSAPCHD